MVMDKMTLRNVLPGVCLAFLLGLLSACAPLPATSTVEKLNLKGTSTKTPFLAISTYTATSSPAPTLPPSQTPAATDPPASPTGTQTKEPTPTVLPTTLTSTAVAETPLPTSTSDSQKSDERGAAVVQVSVTTNCRTGPGVNYPRLSPLQAGKEAELIGRDASWTYWVIKDPGRTGQNCWLWGYYASTTGNLKALKVFTAPTPPGGYPSPQPTSSPLPTSVPATKAPSKTPRPTKTSTPSGPTPTPNLTPGTTTNTPLPPTATPVPPTATPFPDPGYCAYTSVLTNHEQKIKKLINQARVEHGLPKLRTDSRLVNAARDHGRDMTCNGMSGHNSSDGTRAWVRISLALGHGPNWCDNNWACTEIWSGHGSPEDAFYWWMNHEPYDPNEKDNIHKRMILHTRMTHMGVGAIYYNDGNRTRIYYTVDFARP